MAYLLALLQATTGEHWMVFLLLSGIVIMASWVFALYRQMKVKDEVISKAYGQVADINEKFTASVGKSADNTLLFSKALTDLMTTFKDSIR